MRKHNYLRGGLTMRETWQTDLDYIVARIQEESRKILELTNTGKFDEIPAVSERLKFLTGEATRLVQNYAKN